MDYINGRALIIADAKRGDIGNTSRKNAQAILKTMGCDAITISPYMGRDAIEPFIEDIDKGVFVLAMTSNPGAAEIQNNHNDGRSLYERIIQIASELNYGDNVGIVCPHQILYALLPAAPTRAIGTTRSLHHERLKPSSSGLVPTIAKRKPGPGFLDDR